VVDAGTPRNAPAAHMHGFLSRDGMPPSELLAAGREEVTSYGTHVITGTVVEITSHVGPTFQLTLADGQQLHGRRVLVATGLRDELPAIPGVRERWGRDLLHCPYCHGYEVRDQPLGVLGGTAESVQHALLVRQWSSDLVYFPHTFPVTEADREQLAARGISIIEGHVGRLVLKDDRLRGVELDDGFIVSRTAVFVRPRFVPHSDLLVALGCAVNGDGWVEADPTGHTSVAGVWVAGNAVNPRAQVITAAGEGSATAIAINADLVGEDTGEAVSAFGRASKS
jgi:thioredoxin reductase